MPFSTNLTKAAGATLAAVLAASSLFAQIQPNWVQRTPSGTSPSPRFGHKLAYDIAHSRTVLFGGYTEGNGSSNETWTWDGTSWTKMQPSTIPAGRYYHAMAWDQNLGKVVMIGGLHSSLGILSDMWAWDGSNWAQVLPAHLPTGRTGAGIAFDSARNMLVLYGGYSGGFYNDLWEFNGTDWTKRTPANTPIVPVEFVGFAYDTARQRCVLACGWTGSTVVSWTAEWDGTDWLLKNPATTPPPRSVCSMAYDPLHGKCVLFGGAGAPNPVGDTWEWSGTNWAQIAPGQSPSPRSHPMSVWDPVRKRIVLFGGHTGASSGGYLGDTWEYVDQHKASYVSFGTGCPGSNGTPLLQNTGVPIIGGSFQVALQNGAPSALAVLLIGSSKLTYQSFPLPLNMGPNAPLCNLLVAGNIQLPLVTSAQGTSSTTLPLQNDPSWIGLGVFNQYLIIDAGANAFGLAFSQGGQGYVGEF